jgi:hypothetical protein
MMEAMRSSETSVLTRTTSLNIPEDGIFRGHRRETLISYKYEQNRRVEENEIGGKCSTNG